MSNMGAFGSFELNSIVRGAQLTVVGANRALQNPGIFTSELYKQAALAVASGLAIRILVAIPTIGIRVLIRFLGLFTDLSGSTWDEDITEGISFIENSVLQVPFFLMTFIRQLSPAMDHMFMDSLQWVDQTYIQKHKCDDPSQLRAMYYPNLKLYGGPGASSAQQKKDPYQALKAFGFRFGKKAAVSLGVYLLSLLPHVGRFVLPAASFYTFNKAVGLQPALLIFGSSIFLPKRYLVMFLQSYFSSRTLMRELLEPYFSRIRYTLEQKKQWFHDREGVLFGFAFAFVAFLKIPLLGVLIYGIAEASTAYLITKVTEPPPDPQHAEQFRKEDVHWKNKHEFVSLPLEAIDKFNTTLKEKKHSTTEQEIKIGRQFS
ncbi:hypothetical protein Slin15195_G098540 [Septoria linicola]|uniref:Transmembrane protein UsgS n=1 Tax=Septoria linicola TaxID=215465 RepID=A0A9Q9EMY8_9PEZI|nr:hypothetical protein Slin14017_G061600 [Septoria linicola]USW56535.1 hypothetical protein Slin15195_G098540 [Septoria linicola]